MKKSNVIILIGLPGAGKSTACENWFPHYFRINQDELGSRNECLRVMEQALQEGKDIIIDRVNTTRSQRSYWILLASKYKVKNITGIVLQVNPDTCIERIRSRKSHPTINETIPFETKKNIVYKFLGNLEQPSLDEGFNSILFTRN